MQRKKRLLTLNFTDYKKHLPFFSLTALFLAGVLIGNLLVCKNDSAYNIAYESISKGFSFNEGRSVFTQILISCASLLPYFLIMFAAGMSVVGVAVVPLLLICFGFEYGCVSGLLYSSYQLEGIMYAALLVLPATVIGLFGLLLLSKESVSFSFRLANSCVKAGKPVNLYCEFKRYCTNSSLTLVAALVSIFVDITMSVLFSDYFNFVL